MSLTNQFKPKIIDRKNRIQERYLREVCAVWGKGIQEYQNQQYLKHSSCFLWCLRLPAIEQKHSWTPYPVTSKTSCSPSLLWTGFRTDFWIQHSRLFPHYIFPKQSFLFPDSKLSNRWLIQSLKNAGTKLVFTMQTYGRDWIRFDQNDKRKKKTLIKHLLWLWKKTQDFLPFFQTLSLFSRRFPDLKNCWANFKTFSIIQDSVQHCMDVCILDVILQYVHPQEYHWS